MGSCEPAVMDLESQAVSAEVTKHFVTILVKHVIRNIKGVRALRGYFGPL